MDGLCNLLAQAAGWNRAAFCGGDEDERHHSQVANDRRGHQAQLHHAGAFPKVERADDDGDADYRRKDQSAGQSGVACAAEAGGLCAVHQREQPDCDCRSQGQSARRGGRTAASHDVCADARRSLRVQLERRRFPGARLPDGYRARHRHGGFPRRRHGGQGPGASSIPLTLPRFTVVGATTREGMLPSPLRARFGFTAHLDFYPHDELEKLIERSSGVLGVSLGEGAAAELALRSRGTPRIANRLLRRVRDWAIVHDLQVVDVDDVRAALALYQIDSEGLDRLDIAVLNAIVRNFNGGPVGLNNLAAMVGEESETVETVCEPYLVREGFLIRTPKGRVATAKAWSHLGLEPQGETNGEDVSKLF